jgi:phospholipase/carboxylesterase
VRRQLPRRGLLARAASLFTGLAAATGVTRLGESSSMAGQIGHDAGTPGPEEGRLLARPGLPSETVSPGLHALGLDRDRDALLLVPAGYRADQPAPFVLSLHGAGGDATSGLYPLRDLADEAGLILLSPAARQQTWDVIRGGYGPDVAFIDQALTAAFARCAVNPELLTVAGFSDGASYALSLGITNGDVFGHVMAFSPGFMAPADQRGEPRIFISHGTKDQVLAIDRTSRRIAPQLARAGYDVQYYEFDGPHTVPPEIAQQALDWFISVNDENNLPATPAASAAEPIPAVSRDNQSTPFTLYTFGDSILDSRWYNDQGLDPGQLLVRNDDALFPEFQGQDLSSHGPVRLKHRAVDGATVDSLPAQARNLAPSEKGAAILTVGGNDLLRGLLVDQGPGIAAFATALDAFLRDLPVRPVLLGNVYDPTFGDDTLNFTGVDPELARENHRRVNGVIAELAGKYGALIDLHTHFLSGNPSWCTHTIEPSLHGSSEIRRCFLPHLLAVLAIHADTSATGAG